MALVILDRDGVINQDSDRYVKSAEEWIPLPGSIEAIARLKKAGYTVVVATNQSGLARGYFGDAELQAMHDKMATLLAEFDVAVDAIYHCPHGPDDGCRCRKPAPGMIEQIRTDYGTDLKQVPVIGDSRRDLEAGLELGCLPLLVRTGKGVKTEQDLIHRPLPVAVEVFDNLAAVVDYLLLRH